MAAEFALVLPLLLVFLLGTIDIGIYAWNVNQAEKATQTGARWAAVTDPLAQEIATATYSNVIVDGNTILQGDPIPAGALGKIECVSASCVCVVGPCPGTTFNQAAFESISTRMQQIYPAILNENLQIEYSGSGLGFAGDPNGPDIAPLITVRLVDMSYRSIILSPLGVTTDLPDFAYSITAEDAAGTLSN